MDEESGQDHMRLPTGPISFARLEHVLANLTIEDAYKWLECDYAQHAVINDDRFASEPTPIDTKFSWKRTPTRTDVLRIFNQINSYYADIWIRSNPHDPPLAALETLNQIILFRENKRLGFREKQIEFGVRSHLDFMDLRRRDQWLRGLPAQVLENGLQEWAKIVDTCPRTFDHALLLSLVLVAIHPFSDGNGRCGREIFTWLLHRWNLPLTWLNEDSDGELLRTGSGIDSTEYVMAQVLIKIMHGLNDVAPGENRTIPHGIPEKMSEALTKTLKDLASPDSEILKSPEYIALKKHYEQNGHFVSTSPRFRCLQDLIL